MGFWRRLLGGEQAGPAGPNQAEPSPPDSQPDGFIAIAKTYDGEEAKLIRTGLNMNGVGVLLRQNGQLASSPFGPGEILVTVKTQDAEFAREFLSSEELGRPV